MTHVVTFRVMAVLPAAGTLFAGWLLWALSGEWVRLGTTDRILAALLVAAALGFSVIACTILRAVIAARPAPQPGNGGASAPNTP